MYIKLSLYFFKSVSKSFACQKLIVNGKIIPMGETIFLQVNFQKSHRIFFISIENYISYRITEFSYRNIIQTGSFPKIITLSLADFKMGVLFKSYRN